MQEDMVEAPTQAQAYYVEFRILQDYSLSMPC